VASESPLKCDSVEVQYATLRLTDRRCQ